jgi:hypothetical protein
MTPRQPSHANTRLNPRVISHELCSGSGEHAVDAIVIFVKVNRPLRSEHIIELGKAPGFGWDLDQDFIDAHRVRR